MIIDLRSDTVTKPTPEMLAVMTSAELGDDVYAEDPTVNALQKKVAAMTGKAAALFVPSGTMGNQICLKVLTEAGDEVICENEAHIYYYETAAPSILSSIQLRPLLSERGEIPLTDIEDAIRPDVYYFPKTKVIALENTHNRHSGSIISLEYCRRMRKIAKKHGLFTHLDGARLWNAVAATGVDIKDYISEFDTVSLCFSKGLGTPVGSIIVGSESHIRKALKWRKIFGGGMRQIGILAAACDYALDFNLPKLSDDHKRAKEFAIEAGKIAGLRTAPDEVQTNIVQLFSVNDDAEKLVSLCNTKGLRFSALSKNKCRLVFHIGIDDEMLSQSIDILKKAMRELT